MHIFLFLFRIAVSAGTAAAVGDAAKNQTPPTLLSSLRSVLFVIGTVLIGFAAVCNSLTW